jgi:hypothetical protein
MHRRMQLRTLVSQSCGGRLAHPPPCSHTTASNCGWTSKVGTRKTQHSNSGATCPASSHTSSRRLPLHTAPKLATKPHHQMQHAEAARAASVAISHSLRVSQHEGTSRHSTAQHETCHVMRTVHVRMLQRFGQQHDFGPCSSSKLHMDTVRGLRKQPLLPLAHTLTHACLHTCHADLTHCADHTHGTASEPAEGARRSMRA